MGYQAVCSDQTPPRINKLKSTKDGTNNDEIGHKGLQIKPTHKIHGMYISYTNLNKSNNYNYVDMQALD